MDRPLHDHSDNADWAPPSDVDAQALAPMTVLVVCARGEHLDAVRRITREWPRATQVRWTVDPIEALRQVQDSAPALVIVEARLDRGCGFALIELLRHARPGLEVLAFDDPHSNPRRQQRSTWRWSELPRAIDWWLQHHPLQRRRSASEKAVRLAAGQADF